MTSTPYDYTGFGASGAGSFPTDAQAREVATSRFHTQRVVQDAMLRDPTLQMAMAQVAQLTRDRAKNESEIESLKRLYYSGAGTLVGDSLVYARANMGMGDLRTSAANIYQGVSQGGYQLAVRDGSGRVLDSAQQVRGGGAISEMLAMRMHQQIAEGIYGSGSRTSDKSFGFNQEEVSAITLRLMANGGLGNVGTIVRNADANTRMESMLANTGNPVLRQQLVDATQNRDVMDKLASIDYTRASLREPGRSADERRALEDKLNQQVGELGKVKALSDSPQLRAAIESVATSSDALISNPNIAKEISRTVQTVTQGLRGLKDIYETLNESQLEMQAQSLTGMTSTLGTAKDRNAMLTGIRTAASMTSDPKAFYAAYQASIVSNTPGVAAAAGLDTRSDTAARQITAQMTLASKTFAGAASRSHAETRDLVRDKFGVDIGEKSEKEYEDDAIMMGERFIQIYPGMSAATGALEKMNPEDRKAAQALMDKFYTSDASTRASIDAQMQNMIAGAHGADSFAAYKNSAAYTRDISTSFDVRNGNAMMTRIATLADKDQNYAGAKRILKDNNAEDVDGTFSAMQRVGLRQLAQMKNDKSFTLQGVSAGDATKIRSALDAMSPDQFRRYAALMGSSFGATDMDIRTANRELTDATQFRDTSKFKGGLSLENVIANLLGDNSWMDSPSARLEAAERLTEYGIGNGPDLSQVMRNTDLTRMDEAKLKSLDRLGKTDLAKEFKFGSAAEFVESFNRDENLRKEVLNSLAANQNLTIDGSAKDATVINTDAFEKMRGMDSTAKLKKLALLKSVVFPNLKPGRTSAVIRDAIEGKQLNVTSDSSADAKGGKMANLRHMLDIAGRLNKDTAKELAASGLADGIADSMSKELYAVQEAARGGVKDVNTVTEDGSKKVSTGSVTQNALADALGALREAMGQGGGSSSTSKQGMTVYGDITLHGNIIPTK